MGLQLTARPTGHGSGTSRCAVLAGASEQAGTAAVLGDTNGQGGGAAPKVMVRPCAVGKAGRAEAESRAPAWRRGPRAGSQETTYVFIQSGHFALVLILPGRCKREDDKSCPGGKVNDTPGTFLIVTFPTRHPLNPFPRGPENACWRHTCLQRLPRDNTRFWP